MVARLAGAVASRQDRKSARGNRFAFVQMSDPTGLYEVTVFSDVLESARDLLDTGSSVVITVEATLEGDTLKLLARAIQPIDAVAAEAGGAALRVHLDRAEAAASVASLLARVGEDGDRARGSITICVPDRETGREIDVLLPRVWPVSPQVKGALRAMMGVVLVEEL
jgi:DNA polymerase-3 subunit alpha